MCIRDRYVDIIYGFVRNCISKDRTKLTHKEKYSACLQDKQYLFPTTEHKVTQFTIPINFKKI